MGELNIIVHRTLVEIERGRSNNINYVPTGLPKLDEYTDGIPQGTYILVGAESTVGKTAFVRDKYIHTLYEYYKMINDPSKLDIEIIDMTLEITPQIGMAGAISRKLFMEYQLVVPAKKVLKGMDDQTKRIVDSMIPYFNDFYSKVKVYDEDITPTKYHDILMRVAKENGTFEYEGAFISECGKWIAHNPNKYIEVVLDTINLAEVDSGHTNVKSTIDRISRIGVLFRNKCNFIIINVQQFNAEISAVDRARYGIKTPLMRDFEDSKRTTKDADIVLGLYDPMRHMRQEETIFRNYDISILRSWFRSLHVMKNRRGENLKIIPLKFDGALGIFSQLPDAADMTAHEYNLATKH